MSNLFIRPKLNEEQQQQLTQKVNRTADLVRAVALEFNQLVFANSLGAEDMVLTHLLSTIKTQSIQLITLDTGRLPDETYALLEQAKARYPTLVWKVYFPYSADIELFVDEHGINSFYNTIELRKMCCHIRKIKPLKRALSMADAWMTGLRSEQSNTREMLAEREHDTIFNLPKINPLAAWTTNEIWAYLQINQVPYNPLHEKFFPSIGCAPCTRSVTPGEPIRSGRWWWENSETRECGLHKK